MGVSQLQPKVACLKLGLLQLGGGGCSRNHQQLLDDVHVGVQLLQLRVVPKGVRHLQERRQRNDGGRPHLMHNVSNAPLPPDQVYSQSLGVEVPQARKGGVVSNA